MLVLVVLVLCLVPAEPLTAFPPKCECCPRGTREALEEEPPWLGELQGLQRNRREWEASQTHIPLIHVGTALLGDWMMGKRVMWGGYGVRECGDGRGVQEQGEDCGAGWL